VLFFEDCIFKDSFINGLSESSLLSSLFSVWAALKPISSSRDSPLILTSLNPNLDFHLLFK